jgi:tRNA A-37 threonylcarbamoyl transferase component Bud32
MGALSGKVLIDPTLANQTEKKYIAQKWDEVKHKYYSDLKVVKRFKGGIRADDVSLLQQDIVRKRYKLEWEAQRRFFWHEVGVLRRLKGCRFVPQLLHVDYKNGFLYETYCGGPCPDTPKNRAKARKRIEQLRRKWGVERVANDKIATAFVGEFQSRDGGLNNFTMRNKTVCVIDFGAEGWRIHERPRSQVTNKKMR